MEISTIGLFGHNNKSVIDLGPISWIVQVCSSSSGDHKVPLSLYYWSRHERDCAVKLATELDSLQAASGHTLPSLQFHQTSVQSDLVNPDALVHKKFRPDCKTTD